MQQTTFLHAGLGIKVHITLSAQKLIGYHNIAQVASTLIAMMAALGIDYAYVAKNLSSLEITVWRKDGWVGTMKVKR